MLLAVSAVVIYESSIDYSGYVPQFACMSNYEIPVFVAGGSLVGMSTALLLGHYGVKSLVVERHRGTAIQR